MTPKYNLGNKVYFISETSSLRDGYTLHLAISPLKITGTHMDNKGIYYSFGMDSKRYRDKYLEENIGKTIDECLEILRKQMKTQIHVKEESE